MTTGNQQSGFSFNLNDQEKKILKEAAHGAIAAALDGSSPPQLEQLLQQSEKFQQEGGGFVTLTINGMLRGCIGEIFPTRSIAEVVLERAEDAAMGDPRFPSLTPDEFKQVEIEISLLSPPWKVDGYQEIEIGLHGIVLSKGGRSAVFLPQVAPEQGWDLATTLTHLAQKAGLPTDGWQDGANFSVFTADIF